MSIIGDMTMEDLAEVKRLGFDEATRFIARFTLSDEEKQTVIALAGTNKPRVTLPQQTTYDPHRKLWLASAWLLGASYRQLSLLHSIAPQTVTRSVDRLLPPSERAKGRLAPSITLEQLEVYHREYYSNIDSFAAKSPWEVATKLYHTIGDVE